MTQADEDIKEMQEVMNAFAAELCKISANMFNGRLAFVLAGVVSRQEGDNTLRYVYNLRADHALRIVDIVKESLEGAAALTGMDVSGTKH